MISNPIQYEVPSEWQNEKIFYSLLIFTHYVKYYTRLLVLKILKLGMITSMVEDGALLFSPKALKWIIPLRVSTKIVTMNHVLNLFQYCFRGLHDLEMLKPRSRHLRGWQHDDAEHRGISEISYSFIPVLHCLKGRLLCRIGRNQPVI